MGCNSAFKGLNCSEIIGEGKEIKSQRILQEKDIKIRSLVFSS
jgi:hypothetical protein